MQTMHAAISNLLTSFVESIQGINTLDEFGRILQSLDFERGPLQAFQSRILTEMTQCLKQEFGTIEEKNTLKELGRALQCLEFPDAAWMQNLEDAILTKMKSCLRNELNTYLENNDALVRPFVMRNFGFSLLPTAIHELILSHLDVVPVILIRRVNKYFRGVSLDSRHQVLR